MENATKALIIAGAVLISILLISVGIMVFNASNKPTAEIDNITDRQTVQMFNETFNPYLGNSITATQAKGLISAVNSNKGNAEHKVTLEGSYTTTASIKSNKRYSAVETTDENGYIVTITIGDEIK